jgi:hypothetical protein
MFMYVLIKKRISPNAYLGKKFKDLYGTPKMRFVRAVLRNKTNQVKYRKKKHSAAAIAESNQKVAIIA